MADSVQARVGQVIVGFTGVSLEVVRVHNLHYGVKTSMYNSRLSVAQILHKKNADINK